MPHLSLVLAWPVLEVAPMAGFFDALTPAELGALQDQLRSAERKVLGAARTAADADVWPLVRVAGDVRVLIDEAVMTEHRDIADRTCA